MMAGIPFIIIWGIPGIQYVILLMVPMLFDGFLQLLTSYESGNMRRLFTGILFGIAFDCMLVYFHRTCVKTAGWILKQFVDDAEKVDKTMEIFF